MACCIFGETEEPSPVLNFVSAAYVDYSFHTHAIVSFTGKFRNRENHFFANDKIIETAV